MKLSFAVAFLVAVAASLTVPAQSAPIQGTVILTKSAPVATLLWDATPRVFALANADGSEQSRMRQLEEDGVNVLASRGARLHASKVELQVVYLLHPVAAQYGKPSMADKAKILVLQAKTNDIAGKASQWQRDLAAGKSPAGLTVQVLGKLPH